MKIALLQILPGHSLTQNQLLGIEACRKAKRMGADIALFPEMWSCGYTIPDDLNELEHLAVSVDDPFIGAFRTLAAELDMAIAVTFLERFGPQLRNTVVLFDRHGHQVLRYAKVHTCDFGEERLLTPGDNFPVAELDLDGDTVKVGCMICYDREFPESARILMLKGAEIILVPNACPLELNRLSQLRGRAYENMVGIATCNYPGGYPDCNGHSSAFDGIAYLPGEEGTRDTCLLEAGEAEGIYLVEFDMQMLRQYRQCEVHGNAYRRPRLYHALIEEDIRQPFIRPDYRKI